MQLNESFLFFLCAEWAITFPSERGAYLNTKQQIWLTLKGFQLLFEDIDSQLIKHFFVSWS